MRFIVFGKEILRQGPEVIIDLSCLCLDVPGRKLDFVRQLLGEGREQDILRRRNKLLVFFRMACKRLLMLRFNLRLGTQTIR